MPCGLRQGDNPSNPPMVWAGQMWLVVVVAWLLWGPWAALVALGLIYATHIPIALIYGK